MTSYGRLVLDIARAPKGDGIVLRCGTQQRGGPTIFTTEILAGPTVTEDTLECVLDVAEGTFLSLLKRTVGIQTRLF